MKKYIILFLTLLMLTVSLKAQVALQQGTKTIGGAVSFLTATIKNDYNEQTQTSILLSPQFSKFISENLEFGFQFIYQSDKVEYKQKSNSSYYSNYSYTSEYKALGAGLLLNKYFPTSETIAPFIGAGASILFNPDHSENKIFTFFGQGGLNIFIKEYAAVNIKAQYSIQKPSEGDATGNSLLIGVGMNFYFLAD